MQAYTKFSEVYDLFMQDVPYREWADYIHKILGKFGIHNGLVAELGCGTGTMTELMSGLGYDMIGLDRSEDMLNIAVQKKLESGNDILYLCQDMREFELFGTVGAIICVCDSLNYIMNFEDLVKVFKLVNNYLDPGGLFLFDLNTHYKYQTVMGNSTIAENREESSFIWENYYYQEEQINEYDLTLFVKRQDGLYERYEETHIQKPYTFEEIRMALDLAGMEMVACYDAFSEETPKPESERIYIAAREYGK